MHNNNPTVTALFGPSGGYESRLEHLNHVVRMENASSRQFPESFGVDFSQPLSHVRNEYLTIASGTRLETRRNEEETRILSENQSLVRRLEKYDTVESRLKHHALLASPHDPDHFFTHQGSNTFHRQAEGHRIDNANAVLAERLMLVKPRALSSKKISADVARHDALVRQISKFNKGKFVTCAASPRALREERERQEQSNMLLCPSPPSPSHSPLNSSRGGGGNNLGFGVSIGGGGGATPIAPPPPPLYKCTPLEAKQAAISSLKQRGGGGGGTADSTGGSGGGGSSNSPLHSLTTHPHLLVSSRASPFQETVLYAQPTSPSALTAGDTTNNGNNNAMMIPQPPPPPLFAPSPSSSAEGRGGGGAAPHQLRKYRSPHYQSPQQQLMAAMVASNNYGGLSQQALSPMSGSGGGGGVSLPPVVSSSGGGGGSSSKKKPWQAPSFDDIRNFYYATDASVRSVVSVEKHAMNNGGGGGGGSGRRSVRKRPQLTASERRAQAQQNRAISGQAFYRRGEGSITLMGLYKSNAERMAALAAASAPSSSRFEGRGGVPKRNNNNNNASSSEGGGEGDTLMNGAYFNPFAVPSATSPRRQKKRDAEEGGVAEGGDDNNDPNNSPFGDFSDGGDHTTTTLPMKPAPPARPRSFSLLNEQHRKEAHTREAPRRNHQCSTKRNVVRDAEEEYYYTSRSVFANYNDDDPEPKDMVFTTHDDDGYSSGGGGGAWSPLPSSTRSYSSSQKEQHQRQRFQTQQHVCSKGCFRSHHKQRSEWRRAAQRVDEQRKTDSEKFSIANQMAIQAARRRLMDADE